METLLLVLGMIILFFVLFLIIKSISKRKFCVLCASVSCTWLVLLVLLWLGKFNDRLLIALLMGGSIVGILYLLEKKIAEKKVPEKYLLFRLPLYLTMVSLGYLVLRAARPSFIVIITLLMLWLLFMLIFFYQHNPKLHSVASVAEKLIACCKNW